MAVRYKLIGSQYQAWNKNKKYINEEEALLEGKCFKTLFAIDAFTCDKTLYETLAVLDFKGNKQLKNHLSIHDAYNKRKPFMAAIFEYPEMQEVIMSKKSKEVSGLGEKLKYQSTISLDIPAASQIWNPIYEALLEKNEASLKELLDQTGDFYNQVYRYLTSYYDPSEEIEALKQLKHQFSVYTNFREAFVHQKIEKEKTKGSVKRTSFPVSLKKSTFSLKSTYDISSLPSYIVPTFSNGDKEEFLTDEELNYSYNGVVEEPRPILMKKVSRG